MSKISIANARHCACGEACAGWFLLEGDELILSAPKTQGDTSQAPA